MKGTICVPEGKMYSRFSFLEFIFPRSSRRQIILENAMLIYLSRNREHVSNGKRNRDDRMSGIIPTISNDEGVFNNGHFDM